MLDEACRFKVADLGGAQLRRMAQVAASGLICELEHLRIHGGLNNQGCYCYLGFLLTSISLFYLQYEGPCITYHKNTQTTQTKPETTKKQIKKARPWRRPSKQSLESWSQRSGSASATTRAFIASGLYGLRGLGLGFQGIKRVWVYVLRVSRQIGFRVYRYHKGFGVSVLGFRVAKAFGV